MVRIVMTNGDSYVVDGDLGHVSDSIDGPTARFRLAQGNRLRIILVTANISAIKEMPDAA